MGTVHSLCSRAIQWHLSKCLQLSRSHTLRSRRQRHASSSVTLSGHSWNIHCTASSSTWTSTSLTIHTHWPFISRFTAFITICLWTGAASLTFLSLVLTSFYRLRLVMPPALFAALSLPFTQLAHAIFPAAMANGVIAGAFTFCESTW